MTTKTFFSDVSKKSNFNGSILIFIKNLHVLVHPGLFHQISQPSSEARTLKWLFLAALIQADPLRGWWAPNKENWEAEPAQMCTKSDGVGPNDDALALLLLFRQCVGWYGGTDGMDVGAKAAASPHKHHIQVSVQTRLTVKGSYGWTWTRQGYNQKRHLNTWAKGGEALYCRATPDRLSRWLFCSRRVYVERNLGQGLGH